MKKVNKSKDKVKQVAGNNTGKCKVCRHPHRVDIEIALVVEGKSGKDVEQMIKDNGWDEISYVTILSHKNNHITEADILRLRYIWEKNHIAEENPLIDKEADELSVRLKELHRADKVLQEHTLMFRNVAQAIDEQLALRTEYDDNQIGKKTNGKVVGKDRKAPDKKRASVPLQNSLVNLYKISSEEIRQYQKTKLDLLAIDANYKQAESSQTLVDLIMELPDDEE